MYKSFLVSSLFKKGLLQKLLNLECKDTIKLSELVHFENGKGHENIVSEDGSYILVNSKFISSEGKISRKCNEQLSPLFKDDIVMVMSDLPNGKALAKCYFIDKDNMYSLNQRICLLRTKKCNPKYLFYKLNRNRYYLKFDDKVNQTNLKKDDVLNLSLSLPNLNLQNMIANYITTFDQKINLEESKLNNLNKLKKGFMQNMFI